MRDLTPREILALKSRWIGMRMRDLQGIAYADDGFAGTIVETARIEALNAGKKVL